MTTSMCFPIWLLEVNSFCIPHSVALQLKAILINTSQIKITITHTHTYIYHRYIHTMFILVYKDEQLFKEKKNPS